MAEFYVHAIYGLPSVILYLFVFYIRLTAGTQDRKLSGPFNTIFFTSAAVVGEGKTGSAGPDRLPQLHLHPTPSLLGLHHGVLCLPARRTLHERLLGLLLRGDHLLRLPADNLPPRDDSQSPDSHLPARSLRKGSCTSGKKLQLWKPVNIFGVFVFLFGAPLVASYPHLGGEFYFVEVTTGKAGAYYSVVGRSPMQSSAEHQGLPLLYGNLYLRRRRFMRAS